jgi:hypothetical protein
MIVGTWCARRRIGPGRLRFMSKRFARRRSTLVEADDRPGARITIAKGILRAAVLILTKRSQLPGVRPRTLGAD